MSQKATARPPANSPPFAVVPAASAGTATVPSLGQQLREMLPPRRLHSVSLYDRDANVLWLSEGALGPDEHSVRELRPASFGRGSVTVSHFLLTP